eukprot:COSAG05_NODE_2394_length_3122_cov_3.681111_1_plen_431_part_00
MRLRTLRTFLLAAALPQLPLLLLAASPESCPLKARRTHGWEVHAFHWDATGEGAGDEAYLNNTPAAWHKYDWNVITTVDVFSNGTIDRELLCTAHDHGVRVVIGSAAAVQPMWNGIDGLANAAHRAMLVRSIVSNVQREQADGVNIDIEWPPDSAKQPLTEFVCELSAALRLAVEGAQLSMDMEARPISYHTETMYDYTSLALCVDYFVVMAYDMFTPDMARTNITAANSPLPLVHKGLLEWVTLGVPTQKLVLALPFFGNTFTCLHNKAPAGSDSSNGCVPDPPFSVNPAAFGLEVGFNTIVTELLPLSSTGAQYNDTDQSAFFDYVNESDGKRRRIWYDNPQSLGAKADLACGLGLRGVGAWIADALPIWAPMLCQPMWQALTQPTHCQPPPMLTRNWLWQFRSQQSIEISKRLVQRKWNSHNIVSLE